MDDAKKHIIETLKPMSSVEARQSIATGKVHVGAIDSQNYKFAFSLIEAKESEERAAIDFESLSISRKALRISYIAMILSIIGIIIAWFIKN